MSAIGLNTPPTSEPQNKDIPMSIAIENNNNVDQSSAAPLPPPPPPPPRSLPDLQQQHYQQRGNRNTRTHQRTRSRSDSMDGMEVNTANNESAPLLGVDVTTSSSAFPNAYSYGATGQPMQQQPYYGQQPAAAGAQPYMGYDQHLQNQYWQAYSSEEPFGYGYNQSQTPISYSQQQQQQQQQGYPPRRRSIPSPQPSPRLHAHKEEASSSATNKGDPFSPGYGSLSNNHESNSDEAILMAENDAFRSMLQSTINNTPYGGGGGAPTNTPTTNTKLTASPKGTPKNSTPIPPPPPPPTPSGRNTAGAPAPRQQHRRANSDMALRSHRRTRSGSDNNRVAQSFSAGSARRLPTDPLRNRKKLDSANTNSRQRANSTGYLISPDMNHNTSGNMPPKHQHHRSFSGGGGFGNKPAHHRRGSSMASMSGQSLVSEASFVSIVSDIGKSAFFKGVNEYTGQVEMGYPFENIHIVMARDDLEIGKFYIVPVDDDVFEDYHLAADMDGVHGWEDLGKDTPCGCNCANCNGCVAKKDLLPTNYFAIAVKDDLYRRVLDEIADSREMPCGLFFCGHHEDVSRPSIGIAAVIVFLLMATILWLSIYYGA